jgi:heme-degrading monooxygenase HmoA
MVIISPDKKVQTVIVRFAVDPSRTEELLADIRQYMENVVIKFPGFLTSTLHRSLDGTRVVNYVQWATLEDYENFVEQALSRDPPEIFQEIPPETKPFEIVAQFFPPCASVPSSQAL